MIPEHIKQKIFELKYAMRMLPTKTLDKIAWKIAFSLPKQIAYLSTIRVCAHGTTGKYGNTNVPSVTALEILHRWN